MTAPDTDAGRMITDAMAALDAEYAAVAAAVAERTEDPRLTPPAVALPSGRVRAKSLNVKKLSKAALASGTAMYPVEEHADYPRPRTRGECPEGPCPWVSCVHHLYLDVSEDTGAIKINHPGKEPWELDETCSLDVADPLRTGVGEGVTLEEVGALLNVTRERVRQVEGRALVQLRRLAPPALRDHLPEAPEPPPDPTPDPERDAKNLRALGLAGWTRVRLDRPGLPEQWRDPDGRIVSRATAIRAARGLLTVAL